MKPKAQEILQDLRKEMRHSLRPTWQKWGKEVAGHLGANTFFKRGPAVLEELDAYFKSKKRMPSDGNLLTILESLTYLDALLEGLHAGEGRRLFFLARFKSLPKDWFSPAMDMLLWKATSQNSTVYLQFFIQRSGKLNY